LPVDFSERSRTAYQAALGLARDCGGRLIVLHVDRPPRFASSLAPELLDRLRRHYPAGYPARVEYRVEDGDPELEVLRVARDTDCDLIVMGTHEQGSIAWMLDSVTRKVVCQALCPVMTLCLPTTRGPPRPEDPASNKVDEPC
jgi:nucleotide-binding universal stress UspA family protein